MSTVDLTEPLEAIRRRAAALCPADAAVVVDAAEALADAIERYHRDYTGACQTIAEMHAAAVGAVTGPRIGVVEDVAAVRAELDALRAHVDELDAAIGRHPASGRPRAAEPDEPAGDQLPILAELLGRIDAERRRASRLVSAGDDLADYVANTLRIVDPRLDQRLGAWRTAREGTSPIK